MAEGSHTRLAGKVAIITGGAQGIGKIAVERFAHEGAHVVIWDVKAAIGEAFVADLQKIGLTAEFHEVNVTQLHSTEAAAKAVFEKNGKIDILVNNAGITRDGSLLKMSADQWQQVIDVNLTGVFNCTKAVAHYMVEKKYGRIINTSSVVGIYGNFGQTNYVATKAGVIGMTKVWGRELGRKGITVNAVAPGFIATEMTEHLPAKVVDMVNERTPLGHFGTPLDIANAYLFLASDEAAYINCAVLSVDGGVTI